jgi:hypothetical protein
MIPAQMSPAALLNARRYWPLWFPEREQMKINNCINYSIKNISYIFSIGSLTTDTGTLNFKYTYDLIYP